MTELVRSVHIGKLQLIDEQTRQMGEAAIPKRTAFVSTNNPNFDPAFYIKRPGMERNEKN